MTAKRMMMSRMRMVVAAQVGRWVRLTKGMEKFTVLVYASWGGGWAVGVACCFRMVG